MDLSSWFHAVADDQAPPSAAGRVVQGILSAAAPLYGAGAWTNRILHETGLRPRRRLPAVVLSVGNITVGGSGKTPFCIWLARWLRDEGRAPAILARGYAREDEASLVVVHDGRRLRAGVGAGGDEPVLIAQALGDTPVVVCSDRGRAGRLALRRFAVDTLVLDDGFQHHALERQGDVVLIDATRPLSRLRLFPRGTLREPLAALSRAHLIVLTRCGQAPRARQLARSLQRRFPHVPVVLSDFRPVDLVRLCDGEALPLADLKGLLVTGVCGVGNPQSFRTTLEGEGARIARFARRADHAPVTRRQVGEWETARRRARARLVVVTEKDAVKIREAGEVPDSFVALRIALRFLDDRSRETAERVLRSRLHAGPVRGYIA